MLTSPILFCLALNVSLYFEFTNKKEHNGALILLSCLFLVAYNYFDFFVLLFFIVSSYLMLKIGNIYFISYLLLIIFGEKFLIFLDLSNKVAGLSFAMITFACLALKGYRRSDVFTGTLFFPHILAGPIISDLRKSRLEFLPRVVLSVYLFSLGVIIAAISFVLIARQPIYIYEFNFVLSSWIALIALFTNFFGYSLIALAYGLLFGLELPVNFNGPGLANGPSDFWKRWHISLSQIMSELVFPFFRRRVVSITGGIDIPLLAIFFTLLTSAVWHGIGLGYFLWFFVHFLMFIIFRFFSASRFLLSMTFLVVSLPSWGFFALGSSSFEDLRNFFKMGILDFNLQTLGIKFIVCLALGSIIFFIPFDRITFSSFRNVNGEWKISSDYVGRIFFLVITFLIYVASCIIWVQGGLEFNYFIYVGF